MAVDRYPSVHADSDHGTVTLGELRDLVAAAEDLPADTIVRGQAIPFKVSDLGNTKGGCLQSVALDVPEDDTARPNRAERRSAQGFGRGRRR